MSVSDFDDGPVGWGPMDSGLPVPDLPAPASADASAPADPAARGWTNPRAPNFRVLPTDLSKLDENGLLNPGDKAAIYAVGSGPGDFHPEREPLILVHGIEGDPKNLQSVVDRFKSDPRYQIYVLCYDDFNRRTSLNGGDFAAELRSLQQRTLGPGRDVTIVAHSMGGIVTREALDQLAGGPGGTGGGGLDKFGDVRFVAVDTPWHGYGGPSDSGAGGFMMNFVRPFMPDGLEDMRAKSDMFAGLYKPMLPDNVETDVCFSTAGTAVDDYDKGDLKPIPDMLAAYFNDETKPVSGDARQMNFYQALVASSQWSGFADEMRDRADAGRLDGATVRAAMAKWFPEFPGDHDGVLKGKPFLDWLSTKLADPS
jgi:pimeloyl-ACP methyl ester carboxylesterase